MQRLQALTSERTIISEYTKHDFELMIKLEHSPDVMRYLNGVELDPEKNRTKHRDMIDYYQQHPGLGVWKASLKDGTHIGHVNLNRPELSSSGLREGPIQIGYLLHKDFWNQGYASELSAMILKHAFDTLSLERVVAISTKENRASTRVMEKVGMKYQGMTSEYYQHELVLYQIERQEWLDFTQ